MLVLVRRTLVVIALLGAATLPGAAAAASPPTPAKEAALAQPLDPEAIRDLMARLSDEEVRKLLIEHLNRNSARPAVKEPAGMGMMGTMADHAGTWRSRAAKIGAAVAALPAATAAALAKLSALPGTVPTPAAVVVLAAMLAAEILAEFIWRRATREWRAQRSAVRGRGILR